MAPTRGGTGSQRQYQWPPTAIMGGPHSVEYSLTITRSRNCVSRETLKASPARGRWSVFSRTEDSSETTSCVLEPLRGARSRINNAL